MALTEAVTLVDLLTEQPDDPLAQALAFEERLGADIAGWHHLSVERDRARLRLYRGEPVWDTADADPMERFLQTVVLPAAEEDVAIRQAVTRQWTQLDSPGVLARNTVVQEQARALVAEPSRWTRPSEHHSSPPGRGDKAAGRLISVGLARRAQLRPSQALFRYPTLICRCPSPPSSVAPRRRPPCATGCWCRPRGC